MFWETKSDDPEHGAQEISVKEILDKIKHIQGKRDVQHVTDLENKKSEEIKRLAAMLRELRHDGRYLQDQTGTFYHQQQDLNQEQQEALKATAITMKRMETAYNQKISAIEQRLSRLSRNYTKVPTPLVHGHFPLSPTPDPHPPRPPADRDRPVTDQAQPRRSGRTTRAPERYGDMFISGLESDLAMTAFTQNAEHEFGEHSPDKTKAKKKVWQVRKPKHYRHTVKSLEANKWKAAMDK
ncbi:hypothetical protein N7540_005146 [Penicillium herquei]|nr:hypothetical protein N7540_005146 [Penicillium herquei]